MKNINPFRSWLLLCMGTLVLLTACFARLEELGQPAQSSQAPVVAIAPTNVITQTVSVTVSPLVSSTQAITPTATLSMTYTPEPPPPTLNVVKRVNLANGTPTNELGEELVRRANGTYNIYLVPPWLLIGTVPEVEARLNQLMEIKPGDERLGWTSVSAPSEMQGVSSPTSLPTLPLRKRVNLMVTPEDELVIMNVRRADGSYDEYWVPGSVFRATTAEIYAKLNQLLEIQLGDEFFGWHSADFSQVRSTPATVATSTP